MITLIILILILIALGGGGLTYNRWGSAYPAGGRNVLYILAVIVLVLILASFFAPLGIGYRAW